MIATGIMKADWKMGYSLDFSDMPFLDESKLREIAKT